MVGERGNFAYIDGANLHKGILELGWRLDYQRFRRWLAEKFNITKAYLFLGLVPRNMALYEDLETLGYTVLLKPTLRDSSGNIKGNCDAEMVLQAVVDVYEDNCREAILVTGDGDFACLVNFLKNKSRLRAVVSPGVSRTSRLLVDALAGAPVFIERFRRQLRCRDLRV